MAHKQQLSASLPPFPTLLCESMYVGIDVGKHQHLAGFVSTTLLARHERFEACPSLKFENTRAGFRTLIDRIAAYVPLEQAYILLEQTGHYHRSLVQYLQEFNLPVYIMHVLKRPVGLLKTDKRDALNLANHLFNQLERGIQVADKTHLVRHLLPSCEEALQLKGWIRHRYELVQEATRRKNKLIAICDELFPEMTQVLKDPTLPTALGIREHFPTPYALATAPASSLTAFTGRGRPSLTQLERLQHLAGQSIGTKEKVRQTGLILEQGQLIRELRLLQEHLAQLEVEIRQVVEQSRQGQILRSIPGIGNIQAAAILAAIGNILNFEKAADLKSYFGWAPSEQRSGTTLDRVHLTQKGSRVMKQMLFLCVAHAVQLDCEWARLYERLVPRKCSYDERRKTYRGKVLVIGRIAGQMIEMIYALLKQDAEVLSQLPRGQEPPPPTLYDAEIHKRHRNGQYRPLKSQLSQARILRIPDPTPS